MRYEIYLTRRAKKELDPQSRKRALGALVTLRDYGFTARLDIKKLRGHRNHYRIRVGKYCILFELEKPRRAMIYVILSRKAAYWHSVGGCLQIVLYVKVGRGVMGQIGRSYSCLCT